MPNRIKNLLMLSGLFLTCTFSTPALAGKVLFIDSYHEGYEWSDGITKSVQEIVTGTGHELKIHRMDTKRNASEEFMKEAALSAKSIIDEYQPDIVIACDDNAQNYLVVPYIKGTDLPVVFCGVNWTAEKYGYPASNVTGMIEVSAADELVSLLKRVSKGERIGYLSSNNETEIKELKNIKSKLGVAFEKEILVDSTAEWKQAYQELQTSVDAVYVMNNSGLADWDTTDIKAFVEANTKVPSGSQYDWMADYSMIVYAKMASEQGQWAAQTAVDILGGKELSSIPLSRNTQGKLILNARLIEAAGTEVPDDIIDAAETVIE